MRLPWPPLLLFTDRRQAVSPLEVVAAAALAGGCRWLVLRDKDLPRSARLDLARRLVALGRPLGATVLVAGDVVDLVLEAGADGVHLPRDGDPAAARARLGREALIGCSTHDLAEARRAAAGGADYATLSPVFESASKPGYGPALGLAGLRAVAEAVDLPLLALGGVTPERAAACLAAGAAGAAVMGPVMRAEDPAACLRAYLAALAGAELGSVDEKAAPTLPEKG